MTLRGRAEKQLGQARMDRDESRYLARRSSDRMRREAKDRARVARRQLDRADVAEALRPDDGEIHDADWWPCRCFECETEEAVFGRAVGHAAVPVRDAMRHVDQCASRNPVGALAAARSDPCPT